MNQQTLLTIYNSGLIATFLLGIFIVLTFMMSRQIQQQRSQTAFQKSEK